MLLVFNSLHLRKVKDTWFIFPFIRLKWNPPSWVDFISPFIWIPLKVHDKTRRFPVFHLQPWTGEAHLCRRTLLLTTPKTKRRMTTLRTIMASKLVPFRRLWRLPKLPPLSSLSSCLNYNCSQNPYLLEDSSRRFDIPSLVSRRSFCSRPLNLDVEATSQAPPPATIGTV